MVDDASAMTSRARAGFRAAHVTIIPKVPARYSRRESQNIERNHPLFFDWSIYTFIFIKIDVFSC